VRNTPGSQLKTIGGDRRKPMTPAQRRWRDRIRKRTKAKDLCQFDYCREVAIGEDKWFCAHHTRAKPRVKMPDPLEWYTLSCWNCSYMAEHKMTRERMLLLVRSGLLVCNYCRKIGTVSLEPAGFGSIQGNAIIDTRKWSKHHTAIKQRGQIEVIGP